MMVRVLAFARLREILGESTLERDAPDGTTAGQFWQGLIAEFPALGDLSASTRLVRNSTFVDAGAALRDGDELALLPPFGGG